jgi:dipeptide/tripeptide permease
VTDAAGAASGTRTALIVGPVLTAIGIAWTAIAPSSAASAAVLVGLITCIVGTHRFGRLGPEPKVEIAAQIDEGPREDDEDEDEDDAPSDAP